MKIYLNIISILLVVNYWNVSGRYLLVEIAKSGDIVEDDGIFQSGKGMLGQLVAKNLRPEGISVGALGKHVAANGRGLKRGLTKLKALTKLKRGPRGFIENGKYVKKRTFELPYKPNHPVSKSSFLFKSPSVAPAFAHKDMIPNYFYRTHWAMKGMKNSLPPKRPKSFPKGKKIRKSDIKHPHFALNTHIHPNPMSQPIVSTFRSGKGMLGPMVAKHLRPGGISVGAPGKHVGWMNGKHAKALRLVKQSLPKIAKKGEY